MPIKLGSGQICIRKIYIKNNTLLVFSTLDTIKFALTRYYHKEDKRQVFKYGTLIALYFFSSLIHESLNRVHYEIFHCFSLYSSPDLVDTLRTDFSMTYTGTLMANRKGLPDDFKSLAGREDGDYFVLYDVTGKKSIHSWLNQKKSGESGLLYNVPDP